MKALIPMLLFGIPMLLFLGFKDMPPLIENSDWRGWALYYSGLALIGLCVISYFIVKDAVKDALERRATRKTVERILALEPRSSWSEWALPAPESYALLRGVTKVKSDAFKLGLLQLIAMGVLAPDGGEAPKGGGGDTTLRRGPAPADGIAGSLIPIHRLWAASARPGRGTSGS